ncbi:hypothetical protein CFP56_009099 [Quercus suber]|uniref:Small acidic protein 1 n=1 Tax=Quercus suber TaxID=58331 RepID=A0AAW0L3F6_QUESU|nr:hypothetical protein CFP56_32522 [Quercus suber]
MGLISRFRVECLLPSPSPPLAFGGVDLVSHSRYRHRRRRCKPSILFLVLTIATEGVNLVAQGEASILINMDDQPSTMAMDVDDVDPLEIFGEGVISMDSKLANADFYNVFEDDFDDSYIN